MADEFSSGAAIIANESPRAVLVDASTQEDYQAFENAIQESVGLFSEKVNANMIHYISSEDLGRVNYLLKSPIFGHYVVRKYGDPKQAGNHYGRLVKLSLRDRAFGLSNFLGPNTKVQVVRFQKSSQKQEGVEAIKNYLISAKFKTRMATVIANAVDEVLMNAMFDAAVDELGRQLYSSTSRATDLPLEGKSSVEMHVGFDGAYVAISVIDHFGSLDKQKLLAHISKRYTDEEYKVRTTVAGAGIGLATVFRSGGNFLFASDSKERTEVTVFFKRTDSFREFKEQFRFLSTQFYF